LEAAVKEARTVYQDQAAGAWNEVSRRAHQGSFEYDRLSVRPTTTELPEALLEQLHGGHAVVVDQQARAMPVSAGITAAGSMLLVPLMLRDQVIGVIGLEQEDANHSWSADEILVVETAANQASLSLENARLLEESQRRAERERLIGQITDKMQRASDLENLVQRAMEELQRALGASYAVVQMGINGHESAQGDGRN
jgi:GAF domain-containing protein